MYVSKFIAPHVPSILGIVNNKNTICMAYISHSVWMSSLAFTIHQSTGAEEVRDKAISQLLPPPFAVIVR